MNTKIASVEEDLEKSVISMMRKNVVSNVKYENIAGELRSPHTLLDDESFIDKHHISNKMA